LRLTLRQVEVFVATARAGSTHGASAEVARSQSAASAALAEFEASLGTPLFDRIGRRLVLNENGRALLPRAQSLLTQAQQLQQWFASGQAGALVVAASFTIGEYLLPPLIATWSAAQPASPVQLRIGNTRDVIEAVAGFEAELGFIEGQQTHPDLVSRPWWMDELVVVAAPGHVLGDSASVGVRALSRAAWAMREQGSGTRSVVDAWLTEHLDEVRVAYELGSTEAVKHVVAAGDALACLSRHAVAQAIEDGRLVELKHRLPPARRRLLIVQHRSRAEGRAAAGFLAHCLAGFRRPARPHDAARSAQAAYRVRHTRGQGQQEDFGGQGQDVTPAPVRSSARPKQ
jgi:DNA-binding transcriptional LysR family regulator